LTQSILHSRTTR